MKIVSTFSIIARDPVTKEIGIAVQSKFLAVGSNVIWAKANVGAIATQAYANFDIGELGMKFLEKGYSAEKTRDAMIAIDDGIEDRQFGIVDAQGGSISFTGKRCYDYAGGIAEENLACQGNILVSKKTIDELCSTFKKTKGTLAERLVIALDAAQNAGGDKRGKQSAALLVVKEKGSYGGYNDRYIDLRVDDDVEPIKKLSHLLKLHKMYFEKTKEEDKLIVDEKLAKEIQQALKELGYYKYDINGKYDEKTRAAFTYFCGWENFEERTHEGNIVDRYVIEYLLDKKNSKAL